VAQAGPIESIRQRASLTSVCMQCMATAMMTGAAATGMRAWLATHSPHWMTPRRLKGATAAILAIGVLASGSHMAPNAAPAIAKAGSAPTAAKHR
jgi:hypothetical protein